MNCCTHVYFKKIILPRQEFERATPIISSWISLTIVHWTTGPLNKMPRSFFSYWCLFISRCYVGCATTPACTWWNCPEEDLSSGKSESTHPSRTVVKSIEVFYGVESVVRCNADSLRNWAADHRTKLWPTTSAVSLSRWCAPEPWTVKVPLLGLLQKRH